MAMQDLQGIENTGKKESEVRGVISHMERWQDMQER